MKRQSVLPAKIEENYFLSSLGQSAKFVNMATSNSHLGSNQVSDSDSICNNSKKIHKKRDTYQKVSDEIRLQLLESVQKGETLKSAAKRFNINYSSAKSVLHTYRKEGRILKKSAQERSTKKKYNDNEDNEDSHITDIPQKGQVKSSKKSVAPFVERTASASTCGSYQEGKTSLSRNKCPTTNITKSLKVEHCKNQQEAENRTLTISPMMHLAPASMVDQEEYINPLESFNLNRQKNMLFDNLYMRYSDFHFPDVAADFYRNESHHPNESDSLSVLQPRLPKNEESSHGPNPVFYPKGFSTGFNFEDKVTRPESLVHYEDNLENAGNPLKNLMDTQFFFQEALKKASFWGGNSNQGFRKNSFDLF